MPLSLLSKFATPALLAIILLLSACSNETTSEPIAALAEDSNTRTQQIENIARLRAQSNEFPKGIEQVTEGVWVAIGYALANSILIEGDDGLIVVDTLESLDSAEQVAGEFRKLSDKPLKAIIYTHNHADHVFGAQAFVDTLADPNVPVQVWAHADTADLVFRVVSEFRPVTSARAARMFGTHLHDAEHISNGLGPRLDVNKDSRFGFVPPTDSFSDTQSIQIAGVDIELVHAPGETEDQLFVWLPKKGILCPGDNIYKAFPNLYTIRGTRYRSQKQWAASIDKMRALPVQHLVPSHTRPLHGQEAIYAVLTNYRDAIRFVHDQSVRWINQGLTAEQVAAKVKLPPHLVAEPYLQEFYGTARWSSRSVFSGNLGWFDGRASQLDPLSLDAQAQRMLGLVGGVEPLSAAVEKAIEAEDWQWALQLSELVMLAAKPKSKAFKSAKQAKINALTQLGQAQSNPNARHYYLSEALELTSGFPDSQVSQGSDAMIRAIPLQNVFDSLAANLRAEDALEVNTKLGFDFTDSKQQWTLWVRRGVVEHHSGLMENLDIHVKVDSLKFKKMLAKQRSAIRALATDFDFEKGGRIELARLLKLFKADD